MIPKTQTLLKDGLSLIPGLNFLIGGSEIGTAIHNLRKYKKINRLHKIMDEAKAESPHFFRKQAHTIDDIFRSQEQLGKKVPISSGVFNREKRVFDRALVLTFADMIDKIDKIDATKEVPQENLRALKLYQELYKSENNQPNAMPSKQILDNLEKEQKNKALIGLLYLIPVIGAVAAFIIHCSQKPTKPEKNLSQASSNPTPVDLANQMKEGVKRLNFTEVDSATFFVKVAFEQGEVKKQFLLKNEDGTNVSKEAFLNELKKIQTFIEHSSTELGKCKQFDWLFFVRVTKKSLAMAHGDSAYAETNVSQSHKMENKQNFGTATGSAAATGAAQFGYAMGFNLKEYIKPKSGGELIPGPFYQKL